MVLLKQTQPLTAKIQSWVVDFEEDHGNGNSEGSVGNLEAESVIVSVGEPRNVTARVSTADLPELSFDSPTSKPGSLQIICALPAVNDAPSRELDLEAWVRGGASDWRPTPLRASVRTARTLWLESRAVVYASDELTRDALDAMVRFTVAEREMTCLEQEMHSLWPSITEDAKLTHAVTRRDVKRQEHINAMTVLAAGMKSSSLRIRLALEQLDPALTEPSKRLFAELALAANLEDRLECLVEPIQFAVDHYELANTRLIDRRTSSRENANFIFELTAEVTIIVILLAELFVILYGIRLIS